MSDNDSDIALAHRESGLFGQPAIHEAMRVATGLSDEQIDKVSEGLASIGVGLILPNGIDTQAKYANAISLVRDHGYSANRAARELGISGTHLVRRLNSIGTNGDLESQAAAGDRRILEMSQAMSTRAGEMILDRMEDQGDEIKMTELQKISEASTNQVAAKRRWVQGGGAGDAGRGLSALAELIQGKRVTLEDVDAASLPVWSEFI
jgi:hypothetical protein